jgi:S-adenosylmethionine/arginine decarboxylase-like enzyme
MPLHNQLLVNGYTDKPLTDEKSAVEWMQSLVDSINMNTLMGPYATYSTKAGNQGLTCIVVIDTSHIAIHLWDEPNPAELQLDLYTCAELPTDEVLKKLEEELGLRDYHYMVIERSSGFEIVERNRGGYDRNE